ncbi:MAG: urease accessory protein, partial [Frankiales bacterium]|nr:urease accessory protein [Frankiales bacterium]
DLSVMDRDAKAVRGDAPVIFSSLREQPSTPDVSAWVLERVADWTRVR